MKHLDYASPKDSATFLKLNEIVYDIPFVNKGKTIYVANTPAVFDIEASSFYIDDTKQATMYAWVFGINGRCVRGRTWDEFLKLIDKLVLLYDLNPKRRLIVYVHNLSYEFQWLHKYFEWHKVFSVDSRKPLYAITSNGIEFRCSYLLSGYSLEVLGENLTKYKVNKKVGDLDYRLVRHCQTPLTEKEWGYILNDGLVVMAHIQEEIERLGDITQIPLTKTGYVRNLCKENCLKGLGRFGYVSMMKGLTLTAEQYKQLKYTYMGGFTHANVKFVNKLLNNVDSFDFTSSYPAVMVSEYYPMSRPFPYKIKDEDDFICMLKNFCCMFTVRFTNIRASVDFENYISYSKCLECEHYIINNGRIVEADTLTICLTEQDFFIITQMYIWDDMDISNFHYFYKGYLPKEIVSTIMDLYKNKTELKGVPDKEVEYLISKGMINSVYGMCVTDICRDEVVYGNKTWSVEKANIEQQIEKYNSNRERVLFYAWGVWVTAYARKNLFTGILEFKEDYIYSDTDSLKVMNTAKHMDYIKQYNTNIMNKIYACLDHHGLPRELASPKTIKGVSKPLGVWDFEGTYDKFKTLGAKRYMVEKNGELEITIAGVNKKAGARYLKHKYGNNDSVFDNFADGLEFPAEYDKNGVVDNGSGKLCHTYIDDYIGGEVIDYLGNKSYYSEQSSIHMENTEYTLGLDAMFRKMILGYEDSCII